MYDTDRTKHAPHSILRRTACVHRSTDTVRCVALIVLRDNMIFIRYVGRHSPNQGRVSQRFHIIGSDTGRKAITLQCFKLSETVLRPRP